MSDRPEPDPARERELDELRRILVGRESQELARLERRIDQLAPQPDDVARVLPDAIRIETKRGDRLARSLAPTVESALQESVRKNPKALADAIFPVIGPAIRNAVEAMLAAMVDRLNRAVDHSLSPRSIGWRFEAWRTNRSFGEVVLLKSLVYRVEQALLLRTESGLLVKHVAHPAVAIQDPDLVAGMLTAINDFVADSFAKGADQALEHVEYADKTLELVRGPRLTLAVHVRGQPPRELRLRMTALLEELHAKLAALEGDHASDDTIAADLEPVLARALEAQERARGGRAKTPLVVFAVVLAALVLVGVWGVLTRARRTERFDLLANAFRAEPGYVVLAAERNGDRSSFDGLRDPLARVPADVATEVGLDLEGVETSFAAYASLDRPIVARRLQTALTPPPSVTATVAGERVELAGRAEHRWIALARSLAGALADRTLLDETRLVDVDLESLRALVASLDGRVYPGVSGPASDIGMRMSSQDALRTELTRVEILARAAERDVAVRIVVESPAGPDGFAKEFAHGGFERCTFTFDDARSPRNRAEKWSLGPGAFGLRIALVEEAK
jgi:OOP family OmpA-OmpF porin